MPEPKECRSCNAPIYWLRNAKTQGLAPIDVAPTLDGNIAIVGDHYHVMTGDLFEEMLPGPYHKNHFATCPNSKDHKKK